MRLPYNVQIELVEGCDRLCWFCGIRSIRSKPNEDIRFMEIRRLGQIIKGLKAWGFKKKRVELAMHGEPTLHPELRKCIAMLRQGLPDCQIQLTTNGNRLFNEDDVDSLFDCGLNILIVDAYTGLAKFRKQFHERSTVKVYDYYEDGFNPYHYHGGNIPDLRCTVLMDDIASRDGQAAARKILNHAGNSDAKLLRMNGVPVKALPLSKKCTRPFRELVVHWDGTVPICCMDWRHEFILGQFPEDGDFEEIWNGPTANCARKLLFHRQRHMAPCYKCDYDGGFRVGLIEEPEPFSIEQSFAYLTAHADTIRQHVHASVADQPLTFDPTSKGIMSYIGKGRKV